MNLPPLNSIRAFEAVARLGSVSAAAGELNVTAGAVSQQVKILQGHLGMELLARRGRHLALTVTGSQLHRRLSRAMIEIQAAIHSIQHDAPDTAVPIKLRLSLPPTPAIASPSAILGDLADCPEGLDLSIVATPFGDEIDWKSVDCAVLHGAPPWAGFHWRCLRPTQLVPVCSPELSRGASTIRGVADLRRHRLLHEDDGSLWRDWLAGAGMALPGTQGIHFAAPAMALQAARDGLGVALVEASEARKDLQAGRLLQPLKMTLSTQSGYYLLAPAERCAETLFERLCQTLAPAALAPCG